MSRKGDESVLVYQVQRKTEQKSGLQATLEQDLLFSIKEDLYIRVWISRQPWDRIRPLYVKLNQLEGLKQPGSPGAVFLSFLKFRTVDIEGIEISRQHWNKISSLFLNNLTRRGYSNSRVALERPTVDLVHVEVGRRTCPPNHLCVPQLAQQCRFACPKSFAETQAAFGVGNQRRSLRRRQQILTTRFTFNCYYTLFSYRAKKYCDQQSFCVLSATRTHLSALKKWMVWALLLNS